MDFMEEVMRDLDENPDAFPHDGNHGMTLRDWFAGRAVLGLLDVTPLDPEKVASRAYAVADAMLTARREPSDG
jgi:hypothetical protein